MNIYTPTKKETEQVLTNHTPLSACFMTGDFNSHHSEWYGERSDHKELLRNSSGLAKFMVDWTDWFGFCLKITPGVVMHFPSNGNSPSIIDLTFIRGHLTTITKGWSWDIGKAGDSDHAVTTRLLAMHPPTIIPRRLYRQMDWAAFNVDLRGLPCPDEAWADGPSGDGMAHDLTTCIHEGINIAVLWSIPSARGKRWWTPEISFHQAKVAATRRTCREQADSQAAKATRKQAGNAWRTAILDTVDILGENIPPRQPLLGGAGA